MKKRSALIASILIGLVVIGGLVYARVRNSNFVPEQVGIAEEHTFMPKPLTPAPEQKQPTPLPEEYALAVPFTPQAPTGNWDQLHNEACEEASSIMAYAFFSGDTREKLPASEVEKKIDDLTVWQESHYGYHLDTTADETMFMMNGFYGLHAYTIPNFTEQQVKQEIAAGHVVIIPVNGQQIHNPYYKQPGPIYHMLVVRGYTKDKIVTNDSGTKRGQNYGYDFSTIQKAAADWDHATDTIDQTKKVMIVVAQ